MAELKQFTMQNALHSPAGTGIAIASPLQSYWLETASVAMCHFLLHVRDGPTPCAINTVRP